MPPFSADVMCVPGVEGVGRGRWETSIWKRLWSWEGGRAVGTAHQGPQSCGWHAGPSVRGNGAQSTGPSSLVLSTHTAWAWCPGCFAGDSKTALIFLPVSGSSPRVTPRPVAAKGQCQGQRPDSHPDFHSLQHGWIVLRPHG